MIAACGTMSTRGGSSGRTAMKSADTISTRLQNLPRHAKLALAAARLRERYSHVPGWMPLPGENEDEHWESVAASNFNAYLLPPLSAGIPSEAEHDGL